MSKHTQSSTSPTAAKPSVDLDSPDTLTDEDYIKFFQLNLEADGTENLDEHLDKADQKLAEGKFWEAHKMVRERVSKPPSWISPFWVPPLTMDRMR